MKVLLVLTDLYRHAGGGQTVTKRIIAASPDIDFYYFRALEAPDSPRPANAHAVPSLAPIRIGLLTPPPHQMKLVGALEQADAFARSVAEQSFDIVESPDYEVYGAMLRSAFARHRVKVGRFVLSMHGNISTSIEMNWNSAGDSSLELKSLEASQFASADGVYGLSQRYIASWQEKIDRDVHYFDPAHFVDIRPVRSWSPPQNIAPSLYCIGRSERLKGNDIFIELLRWIDADSYEKAGHIGPQDFSSGVSSGYILENIARHRGMVVPHLPALSSEELAALYAKSSIVVLPSRYDTLNLVALEALFAGCPVAISNRAGVCDYLDEHHPHLPYLKIDLDNLYSAVPLLRDLIANYDDHRRRLVEALTAHPTAALTAFDMKAFYEQVLAAPARHSKNIPYEDRKRSGDRKIAFVLSRLVSQKYKTFLRRLNRAPRQVLLEWIKRAGQFNNAFFFSTMLDSRAIPGRLNHIEHQPEQSQNQLRHKLNALYDAAGSPLYRCNFWLDIARVERERGKEMMAVAYELRILRLLGDDRLGLLPQVTDTLRRNNLPYEAEAAEALYSDPAQAEERVYQLLKAREGKLRSYGEKPLEIRDDRRIGGAPRVSVIVSLYNAADKLGFFLTALAQQTLVRNGEVEIVLVDSGSPADERAAFEAFHRDQPLSILYVRSQQRETIQAAWNRGILLARAPYLVFLGVDETLYPEGFELLAKELDQHSATDWVMSNSFVTGVEPSGLLQNDIMTYRRGDAEKDLVRLETTYLSWVGGMYRKSLHDRFGYYDEEFGGAGDTEFKNRLLSHLNVRFMDRTLGLFLNYPDGQTTASPKAEIEDSRAWYLHRTPGGIRYAFENLPVEDAEALLVHALGYRKAYTHHISSDIEYAFHLASYIKRRKPDSAIATMLLDDMRSLLETLKSLEFTPITPTRFAGFMSMVRAWKKARSVQARHRAALPSLAKATYQIFNDNRYEQHSWLWKS